MATDDIRQDFHQAGIFISSLPVYKIIAFIEDDLYKIKNQFPDFHDFLCMRLANINRENEKHKLSILRALLNYSGITEEAELSIAKREGTRSENREIYKLMKSRESRHLATELFLVDKMLDRIPYIGFNSQWFVQYYLRFEDAQVRVARSSSEYLRGALASNPHIHLTPQEILTDKDPETAIPLLIRNPSLSPKLQKQFVLSHNKLMQTAIAQDVFLNKDDEVVDSAIQMGRLTKEFRSKFRARINMYAQTTDRLLQGVVGINFCAIGPK